MADDYGKALDTLESAFSDSSRQGIRQIKTEWLKVLKYKNDLLAKENEVAGVQEKITHLKELKCQNEKYLYTAQSKLQNLKQSDIQLKEKLNDLKKEETRIVEKCRQEEEYMQKKLSFYEEKWRKRQETVGSRNPQIREKQKAIFEMEELKRKLLSLEQDYQKFEKDLFQAKCDRNKRTCEESEARSFKNLVVKIAQMYVDTKKMFSECAKTSEEIRTIERRIDEQKSKRQKHSIASVRSVAVENFTNNLNVGGSSDTESNRVRETNKPVQNFENNLNVMSDQSIMETRSDNTTITLKNVAVNFVKDNNCISNAKISNVGLKSESKGSSLNNFENFQNKPVDNQNINLSAEIFEDSRITSDDARKGNVASVFEKLPPVVSKVRKWMEKLRIYVPTFGSDEKAQNEDLGLQRSSECSESKSSNEKKTSLNSHLPRETVISSNNYIRAPKYDSFGRDSSFARNTYENVVKPSNQNLFSSPVKIQTSNINTDAHLSEQKSSSTLKNMSKYFGKNNSTSAMDWDEVHSPDKNETAQVVPSESQKQNVEASVVTVQNNATNKEDCLKEINTFEFKASGEAKDESKGHELFSKIQQTNTISLKFSEEKQVEEKNILLGQEDKKEDIDTEMVEVTTEINAVPDSSSKMDVTDNQLDDLKANLQTSPKQNEKQIAEKEGLTSAIPKPTTKSTLPPVEPTVDQLSVKQSSHESNQHHDQVMTHEQREGNEKEVFNKKNEKHNHELDSVPNVYQKDTISSISIPSPFSAAPTPLSMDTSQISVESNPKTSMVTVTQAPASITTQEVMTAASDFPLYKSDNPSPGFAYTSRLMFEALASPSDIDKSQMTYKDLPKDILAQLAYFNKSPSNMNFPPSLPKSPDDDRSGAFLASAYEDYLEDSPSPTKAKESSMFQFGDDSPEKGGKDDFFPLFGGNNNRESSKDSKEESGGQFTFNFGGGEEKSPEEASGFKFLF